MISGHRAPMPDTTMAWAFWRALEAWARCQTRGPVTLPVGRVDPTELKLVIIRILELRLIRSEGRTGRDNGPADAPREFNPEIRTANHE
jgi:hypothetical protein